MKRIGPLVLIASFGVSTLLLDCADYDPCNACHGHVDLPDTAEEAGPCGHDDAPGTPCHHHQEMHCCCAHAQALFMTGAPDWMSLGAAEPVPIPMERVASEPSPRPVFHIPIA